MRRRTRRDGGLRLPRHPGAQLEVVEAENAPRLVVCEPATAALRAACPALAARPHLDAGRLVEWDGGDDEPAFVERGPGDPALRTYSSGTTGQVKGIEHPHNGFERSLAYHREVLGIGPGRRVLVTSKLPFAYALVTGLLTPLGLGATICLHPDKDGLERIALVGVADRAGDGIETALPGWLGERLARHKLPRWVVRAAELPRTHTGKVQRYRLGALVEAALDGR